MPAKLHSIGKNKNERGSLLATVLWAIALMVLLMSLIFQNVSQRIKVVKKLFREMTFQQSILSVPGFAFQALQDDAAKDRIDGLFDSFSEGWAAGEGSFFRQPLSFGKGTLTFKHRLYESSEEYSWIPGLADESSKLNLNTASLENLSLFFEALAEDVESEDSSLAAAIVDWRDGNDAIHLGGAESDYYESLQEPYPAKNAPFECLEELLLVKGMTEALFLKARGHLTVYTDGRINMNTAGYLVLKALGAGDETVQEILSFRKGADGENGTSDDGIFEQGGQVLSDISRSQALDAAQMNQLTQVTGSQQTAVRSEVFSANAYFTEGSFQRRLKMVMDRNGQILAWNELRS